MKRILPIAKWKQGMNEYDVIFKTYNKGVMKPVRSEKMYAQNVDELRRYLIDDYMNKGKYKLITVNANRTNGTLMCTDGGRILWGTGNHVYNVDRMTGTLKR